MDPTTLRLFMGSATGGGLPDIGAEFEGGYFAGTISHTADGVATHALVVAPGATGTSGTSYPTTTMLAWKTATTSTSGTTSVFDGVANTDAMETAGIASHPAAEFCVNLSIGGYSDWYLAALYEQAIAYVNLKPTTSANNTSFGINDYSVPKRTSNYTSGDPAQTSVLIFRSGSTEPFVDGSHWTSTETSATNGWDHRYGPDATSSGSWNSTSKTTGRRVRAFRRIAL